MKKSFLRASALILTLVTVIGLCSCSKSELDPVNYVKEKTQLSLEGFECVDSFDSHGGFNGDGEAYYVLTSKTGKELSFPDEHWHSLPLTDELSQVIYGSDKKLYDVTIPEVTNGYYCFVDRSNYDENNNVIYDYDNLTPHSFDLYNFTIAIYDTDNKMFYYYELDT